MNRTLTSFVVSAVLAPALLTSWLHATPEDAAPKKKADVEKTREVKAKNLTLRVPESWKEQRPTTSMRIAQFEVPAAKGDKDPGELVFYYFPGGAGGVKANLDRWINQFESKDRKVKLTKGKSTQGSYYLAEVTGTYNKPVGAPRLQRSKRIPGSKLLAAVLEAKDGMYYIKLAGPEKTITSVAKSFRGSFGANVKTEEKLEL